MWMNFTMNVDECGCVDFSAAAAGAVFLSPTLVSPLPLRLTAPVRPSAHAPRRPSSRRELARLLLGALRQRLPLLLLIIIIIAP